MRNIMRSVFWVVAGIFSGNVLVGKSLSISEVIGVFVFVFVVFIAIELPTDYFRKFKSKN